MPTPLRVVIVEDRLEDAELMLYELRRAGFDPQWQRVDTEEEYLQQLATQPDLILADYTLPQFDALHALRLWRQSGLSSPFLVVTGTISEEAAVECMKHGAFDYLLKDRLTRLGPAVLRALEEYHLRREKLQAEVALRQSAEQFRALAEGSIQGILIHRDDRPLFVNQAYADIFGYEMAAILAMPSVNILVAPQDQERLRHYAQARLSGEVAPTHFEYQGRRADGSLLWLDHKVAGITWDNEPAIQSTVFDITARKRLEDQVRQTQKMQAIGTLAGGIAHDFNNILNAILGYTELSLESLPQGSELRHYLKQVFTAGQRARDLVRQILAFSRQTEQQRRPVNLASLLKELLKLLRATLPATIVVETSIAQHLEEVLGDPTQLHQVLMNLCTNAEHAMREHGGTLTIYLDMAIPPEGVLPTRPLLPLQPYVRLQVQDTGHGMSPEIVERIFEPFFTTKLPGEGTGMGLSVVHGIVSSYEGAITVDSTPGQGTLFTIYLPRCNTIVTGDHLLPEYSPLRGKECVLFVDDEVTLAQMGQEMLSRLGYKVVTQTSSQEALELFRLDPQRFDLVMTDYAMPYMDGATLAQELRRLRPDIPIVLCTGFSHTMTEERAQLLGIDAFCMKPLLSRDMAEVIHEVLKTRKDPA